MYFCARLLEAAGLAFVGLDDCCCLNVVQPQWEPLPTVGVTSILTSLLCDLKIVHDIELTNWC